MWSFVEVASGVCKLSASEGFITVFITYDSYIPIKGFKYLDDLCFRLIYYDVVYILTGTHLYLSLH